MCRSRGRLLPEDDSVVGVLAGGASVSGGKADVLRCQRVVAAFERAQVGGGHAVQDKEYGDDHMVQDEEDVKCWSPSTASSPSVELRFTAKN
jgi:hypothetical protein